MERVLQLVAKTDVKLIAPVLVRSVPWVILQSFDVCSKHAVGYFSRHRLVPGREAENWHRLCSSPF